jgi:hypothetical protein
VSQCVSPNTKKHMNTTHAHILAHTRTYAYTHRHARARAHTHTHTTHTQLCTVDEGRKHSLSGGFIWQYSLARALSASFNPACSSFSTSSREGAGTEKGGGWCGDDVGGSGVGEGTHGPSLIMDLRNMVENRPGVCVCGAGGGRRG